MKMEYIITFKNTNQAIKAEKCLEERDLKVTVLPLPSKIRAGCGICLKLRAEDIEPALSALATNEVHDIGVYSMEGAKSDASFKEVEDLNTLKGKKLHSLLDNCTSGGCGAKISPGELSKLLTSLPVRSDANLLVGYGSSDDAAVYRIDDHRSLVMTADFFPPMVDEPRTFGRIAATNALSDIYAMGGEPLTALNLVCFPESLDLEILNEILTGGAEKVMEAGAALAGGHSIYDKEPKYGLAVTGIIDNDRIIRNDTPERGHKLILTKPLGTGIIMAALRGEVASGAAVDKAVAAMERLNKYAAEKMRNYTVSACTDITGFGLMVHMLEMASDKVSILLYQGEIPYFEEAYQYAEEYLVTAAGQRNRNFLAGKADVSALPFALQELLFDPQTSGGLLIAVKEGQAAALLAEIQAEDPDARIIGEIVARDRDIILF